ncbi:MAG TPA: SCO family protein, partial [Chitinophagaceae bacterium]|nr:SCO family protein [Chitinophagaceae bacterium]
MSKRILFNILFFAALVVAFYFIMTRLIPNFGGKDLPTLSYVQPFRFTNQEGQAITNKDMAGKVCVVEYFFTTCKGICP